MDKPTNDLSPREPIAETMARHAAEEELQHAGAVGESVYGIPNEHPRTKDWWEGYDIVTYSSMDWPDTIAKQVKLPNSKGDGPKEYTVLTNRDSPTHHAVMALEAALWELSHQ